MTIKLANRLEKIKPSATLAVAQKAQILAAQGRDIVSLGTGEPDFDTPDYIKQAAIRAINEGFTKYTATDGIASLKQAIIQKFATDNDLTYSLKQVMVSCGGKQCLYNLCQVLLDPNDEVIIPAPYWVSYPDMVLLAGATPRIISSRAATHYKITPAQLEAAITPHTKLFILNSPSNPTGVAYSALELQALADVLRRHPHVFIVTDDLYEHIIWSQPFVNIVMVAKDLADRTVVVNGVSKAFAMTGWRIGYAAGPEAIIEAMTTLQSQSTSNPCSIAQKAAEQALREGSHFVKEMTATFQSRHDYLIDALSNIPGLTLTPADGTFYLFPDISTLIQQGNFIDDIDFSTQLLEKVGLALVPGSAFGLKGCIRLSFAASMETLRKAVDRLQQFCQFSVN